MVFILSQYGSINHRFTPLLAFGMDLRRTSRAYSFASTNQRLLAHVASARGDRRDARKLEQRMAFHRP